MARGVYPELSDRALGWLRFLWDKATTPDDWSISGRPNEWWGDRTGPSTELFARFDLSKSTYAVAAMADQTPTWRQGYTRILSDLIERHTSYWASVDCPKCGTTSLLPPQFALCGTAAGSQRV